MKVHKLFKSSELIHKSALSETPCVFVMFSLELTLLMFGKQKRTHTGYSSYLYRFEDGTECSETSAYKIQTPKNHLKVTIQHSEHDKILKSRKRDHFLLQ
jgi:hypothetical protein